eukprot:snap_masked-scaffold_11-processed-gene-9.3-mRNA-1 protein AED:0.01 eAED:0.01 QI:22/1/1/1/1/1/2/144/297
MAVEKILSNNEKAVYDRQIRLWGIEAQKRIQNSNVLVSGISGIGAEVCKNLVLAGINLTIHDQEKVRDEDLGANFFLQVEDIGKNRADSALSRIAALNSLVTVSLLEHHQTVETLLEKDLENFDILILCDYLIDSKIIYKLNSLCRKTQTTFFYAKSFGLESIFFADLGDNFEFHLLEKQEEKYVKVKKDLKYISLEDSLRISWDEKKVFPENKRKKIPDVFYAFSCLLQGKEDEKYDDLINKGKDLIEVNPVCSVMGGIIGQEVVKVISREGSFPIENYFFYNCMEARGAVKRIIL